jgi:methyltransferase
VDRVHAIISAGLVVSFLLGETAISRRHARALGARGAVEPPGDVHRWMQVAYPASFLAMIGEGLWRGLPAPPVWWAGLIVFLLSKALKVWAIGALGPLWSFRVLVLPGQRLVSRGPYRVLRHPNYVAVAGELVSVALMFGAVVAGPVAAGAFGALLWRRIRVEEAAMRDVEK